MYSSWGRKESDTTEQLSLSLEDFLTSGKGSCLWKHSSLIHLYAIFTSEITGFQPTFMLLLLLMSRMEPLSPVFQNIDIDLPGICSEVTSL